MWRKYRASFALMLLAGVLVGPPAAGAASPTEAAAALSAGRPARLEAIDGSNIKKITLTPKAAQRLDVQTGKVRQDPSGRKVVPYAAVVYDKDGSTWVYTNPQPLTYIRQAIIVELINGEKGKHTHAGVLEFVAEEGRAYIPQWVCSIPDCSAYHKEDLTP